MPLIMAIIIPLGLTLWILKKLRTWDFWGNLCVRTDYLVNMFLGIILFLLLSAGIGFLIMPLLGY